MTKKYRQNTNLPMCPEGTVWTLKAILRKQESQVRLVRETPDTEYTFTLYDFLEFFDEYTEEPKEMGV